MTAGILTIGDNGELEDFFTTSSNDDGSDPDGQGDEPEDQLDAMASLEDLLTESLDYARRKQEDKARHKHLRETRDAAKERLRKGGGSDYERAMDRALVMRVAETLGEWKAISNVGMFHRYNCQCGSSHDVFMSVLLHMEHAREKGLRQLLTIPAVRPDLPKYTMIREQAVESCTHCARAAGWDFEQKATWSL